MTLILALIPLDERPVNTRYPQMLGAIGGAEVRLPPEEIRGRQRVPADLPAVAAWLQEMACQSQAALVSTDFLGCGNLINARITQDSAADVLARLHLLEEMHTHCPIHAFALITRAPDANDCVEEPLYWCEWGTRFAQFARLSHRVEQGEATADENDRLITLQNELPAELRADWLTRRLRNHTVTLGLMDMAARGHLTSLLITSDDTAPHGFPSRERDWLRGWPGLIGSALSDRIMMHPGADEVGSALVARLVNQEAERTPRVWVEWSVPGDEERVAPYEDRPVRETVWGQIAACGCVPAARPEDCDFVLGVATPSPHRRDYRPEYLEEDRVTRTADYAQFLLQLAEWQRQGVPVALADVAYPNGADPLLTELLLSSACPLRAAALCAYGAWNTAGNTLGVVVAQACCALSIGTAPKRAAAQNAFLAHRFLEDWGYQSVVRRAARSYAEAEWQRREPAPDNVQEQTQISDFIEKRLQMLLAELQTHGIGQNLSLAPGSTRLPWRRTFEIDFTLSVE